MQSKPKVKEGTLGERHSLLPNYHNVENFYLYIGSILNHCLAFYLAKCMFHLCWNLICSSSMTIEKFHCLIPWHKMCAFQNTTHHLSCFPVFKRNAEQPTTFPAAVTATFSNWYKLLFPCWSPGGCRSEKRSQKTVCKIFPGFLSTMNLLFPPLSLVEWRNSLLEGQMVYTYVHNMI